MPNIGQGPGRGAGQGLGPQRRDPEQTLTPEPTPTPTPEATPELTAEQPLSPEPTPEPTPEADRSPLVDAEPASAAEEVADDGVEVLAAAAEQTAQAATSPTQQPETGVVETLAPRELPADGENRQGILVYQLPSERVLEATDSAVLPQQFTAEVQGGATLPEWLNYDGGTRTFTAVDPPEGALPLPVVVNVPGANGPVAVPVLLGQP